jgi:hypothetical protein
VYAADPALQQRVDGWSRVAPAVLAFDLAV